MGCTQKEGIRRAAASPKDRLAVVASNQHEGAGVRQRDHIPGIGGTASMPLGQGIG